MFADLFRNPPHSCWPSIVLIGPYDDSEHFYMGDGFPWYRLRSLIAEKSDARGIALELEASAQETYPEMTN